MLKIQLSDGSTIDRVDPCTISEIIDLAGQSNRRILAARINGRLVDLSFVVSHDSIVHLVSVDDNDALAIIRATGAILLAAAVREMYPNALLAEAHASNEGFHCDVSLGRAISAFELDEIGRRMRKIIAAAPEIRRPQMLPSQAASYFDAKANRFQSALSNQRANLGLLQVYEVGDLSLLSDLPVAPAFAVASVFQLHHVSGAYWQGEADEEMLQRVSGSAWLTEEQMAECVRRHAEAEKRDHRLIGKQLDLFHFQDEAPGLVFWHPKGWSLWQEIEQYLRGCYRANGYAEIKAPQILDRSLWERTGHWDNYRDNMFTTESERRSFALKPMNCPGHVQIFNADLRSYRDLPIRYGEFGQCHRNESSGALHGLMRVRGFTQDDGHIFCSEAQIEAEVVAFHDQAMRVYADFGFEEIAIKLALRPQARIGDDAIWNEAENALRSALRHCGVTWTDLPGEGAFYGPKIEYHLKDCLGRSWQVGTVQVDFSMPGRLAAFYVDEQGVRRSPVMLHRAIVGSMERFIGILIEHHAGAFPFWLAPVQVVIAPIADRHCAYASEVARELTRHGFRLILDDRNERLGLKVREHAVQKIPVMLIIGDAECAADCVTVRKYGEDATYKLGRESLTAELSKLRKPTIISD